MFHFNTKKNVYRSVILTTLLSLLMSLILTSVAIIALDVREWEVLIAICIMVPLCVAPPITYKVFNMAHELERAKTNLKELSIRDHLTGAYNRRFFFEMAQTSIALSLRKEKPLSLCLLDLDHFKKLNDQYGHLAGDLVLKEFTHLINHFIRKADVFARLGGEEFIILMPDSNLSEVLNTAERLRKKVEELSVKYKGTAIGVTVSIGIVSVKETKLSPSELLIHMIDTADHALYAAKKDGRNTVKVAEKQVFLPAHSAEIVA